MDVEIMKYPQIRIKNAWLLRQNASEHLHILWGKEGDDLIDHKGVDEKVAQYQAAWHPYEKKIIHSMCQILDLEFRQNIIDVNIAPWFNAFSDPMVIGINKTPDRFIEVLTHELLHRLLTDNTRTKYDTEYGKEWIKLFGSQNDFITLVHIPVHACLQAVFDDALSEPQRTQNDRKLSQQWDGYREAWAYVDSKGYQTIITQLRDSYKELGEKQRAN